LFFFGPARDGTCPASAFHILLESDTLVVQASERLHQHPEREEHKEEEEKAEDALVPPPQDAGDVEQVPLQAPANAEDTGVLTVVAAVDDATKIPMTTMPTSCREILLIGRLVASAPRTI
jgi:hypothetical protein